MDVAVRNRIMRIEDFLVWEGRQDTKFEFDGYEPVAMAGGTLNHARVQRNLAVAIGRRLRGSPCEFVGSDMKLVAMNRSRYPDGQIICGSVEGQASFTTTPVALFEVLSPGDEARDRVVTLGEYFAITSVQTYVMLEYTHAGALVMIRAGNAWSTQELGADGVIALPEAGIEVPVAELFEGVAFEGG